MAEMTGEVGTFILCLWKYNFQWGNLNTFKLTKLSGPEVSLLEIYPMEVFTNVPVMYVSIKV